MKKDVLEIRLRGYNEKKSGRVRSGEHCALLLTVSAAAGLGAFIAPPPAEAAVQYSGMKNLAMGTNAVPAAHSIDLDGDGVVDFTFIFFNWDWNFIWGTYKSSSEYNSFTLEPALGNSVIGERSIYASLFPSRLPGNYNIQNILPTGPRQWVPAASASLLAGLWRFYSEYSTTAGNTRVTSKFISTWGNFIGKKGYLGVRFKISNETHYGWIQFAADEDLRNGKVIDWAYEDQPETPIRAGDGRFNWSLVLPAIINKPK